VSGGRIDDSSYVAVTKPNHTTKMLRHIPIGKVTRASKAFAELSSKHEARRSSNWHVQEKGMISSSQLNGSLPVCELNCGGQRRGVTTSRLKIDVNT
jgi:hypothetical protein